MHLEILDENRKNILPLLSKINNNFYLAGGTALALQIGHRDSIDFDFFTDSDIDIEKLFDSLAYIFKDHDLVKTHTEKNTLYILVDDSIKISFMKYNYAPIKDLIETEFFKMASIEDIACMKFSAITSRQAMKDYIDLYFILKKISLNDLLVMSDVKFSGQLDRNLILKSIVYFDDIHREEIMYKNKNDVGFDEVKKYLTDCVEKVVV
jgi:predicted nucleotidyltransferase component of viral defense system